MMQPATPVYEHVNEPSVDEAMIALSAVDPDDHQAARRALQRAIHAVTLELISQVPLACEQGG